MQRLSNASGTCMQQRESLADVSLNNCTSIFSARDSVYRGVSSSRVVHRKTPLLTPLLTLSVAPLSPIIASPCSSPSTSTSSDHIVEYGESEAKTNPINHRCSGSSPRRQAGGSQNAPPGVALPLPTWKSTPPTPNENHLRPPYRVSCRKSCLMPPSESYPPPIAKYESRLERQRRRASAPPTSFARFSTLMTQLAAMQPSGITRTDNPTNVMHAHLFSEGTSAWPLEPHSDLNSWPIFHIPNDHSDTEDEGPCSNCESVDMLPNPSPPQSSTGWESETRKDDIRRYHALMELLTSEVAYLSDLRVLVDIYLHQLAKLLPINPSLRNPSLMPNMSSAPSLALPTTPATPHTPYSWFCAPSSTHSLEQLARSAGELLQLHEHFVCELQDAVSSLGISLYPRASESVHDVVTEHTAPASECINEAIRVVSTKFAVEASLFNVYQDFCSDHSDVSSVLHNIQIQRPEEWDAFERRSSALVLQSLEPNGDKYTSAPKTDKDLPTLLDTIASDKSLPEPPTKFAGYSTFWLGTGHKKRSHSLSALDLSLASSHVGSTPMPSPATPKRPNESRLGLMGYLIKPIQRICRYPLLLEQLKAKAALSDRSLTERGGRPDVNVVVDSAAQAMRHVATLVDEAGRRHTVSMQSSLIASRIHLAWAASHSSSPRRAFHLLTPTFVASLGSCLLAGSLDVVHQHSNKAPHVSGRAKYLGAFLYAGGYFILVKVLKGKIYEPRHWFSLSSLKLVDVRDEDAKLPFSFLLSYNDHQLILSAKCQREKELWISSIKTSFSLPSSMTIEPASSLSFDERVDFHCLNPERDSLERDSQLPTARPVSHENEIARGNSSRSAGLTKRVQAFDESSDALAGSESSPLYAACRRSASMRGLLAPLVLDRSDTVRRSSAAARSRADRGLEDVISDSCRQARYQAGLSDGEMTCGLKNARTNIKKSPSGLSLYRLGRRESMFIPRKKVPKESGSTPAPIVPQSKSATLRPKSLSLPRRKERPLLTGLVFQSDGHRRVGTIVESPHPPSETSSGTSNHSSLPATPVNDMPHPTVDSELADETLARPKRTRSMIENVRDLFYSRPPSPDVSVVPAPAFTDLADAGVQRDRLAALAHNATLTPVLLKQWWAKGSLRRRARSSPDVPAEETLTSHHQRSALSLGIPRELSTEESHGRNSLLFCN